MRWASRLRWPPAGWMMGIAAAMLLFLSTAPQAHRVKAGRDCEAGVLDPGDAGLNVLVYRLCRDRLTIGFESSDVVEEISCMPHGDVRLWLLAGEIECDRLPASDRDQVHEVWKPLSGIGGSTAAPVRQLLLCRADIRGRATIIVPDARAALLETRAGNTEYEVMTRRLISTCIRPNA